MLFGDKTKTQKTQKLKQQSDYGITIITSGCHFQGKLHCKGASRIAGKIEGDINSEGMLVIEKDATVNANITTEEIIIHGSVTGSLKASSRVELSNSSRFIGNIKSPCLVIQEGARFDGRSSTETTEQRQDTALHENIEKIHQDHDIEKHDQEALL